MAQPLTPSAAKKLLSSIQYVLFDIDGVLWAGDKVFHKARETVQFLKQREKRVRFVTNNASLSRVDLLAKFTKRGFVGVQLDDIYNSGYASALYLQKLAEGAGNEKYSENVFVVGSRGLHSELRNALSEGNFIYGLELNEDDDFSRYTEEAVVRWASGGLPPPRGFSSASSLFNEGKVSLEQLNFGAVVVGRDPAVTVAKLALAALTIQGAKQRGRDVAFIASNMDPQTPNGAWQLPSTGALVSYIQTACGRPPDAVCGKPNPLLFRILAKKERITDPSTVLMVGDRLTTDISFGIACETQTLHVQTGCETLSDIARTGITPTYTAVGLWSLLDSL